MSRDAMSQHILYSYRRCPYAMRARMALRTAGIHVEQIEISLRDKPAALLAISPKGTVPVLQCSDGRVIDQSLDIMRWALEQNDPDGWLTLAGQAEHLEFIRANDTEFKFWLDRYKYAERFPEFSRSHYRGQAEHFMLSKLEEKLSVNAFLGGKQASLSDVAIFPFVRQFAAVDANWFAASQWVGIRTWLSYWTENETYMQIMLKTTAQAPHISSGAEVR